MSLIPAIQKDLQLVAEMDALLGDQNQFHIWWLGQSGYLLQWKGKRVLIDPYLSDSLTVKYSITEKPHIRMSERVVDPALLKGISIVSSSHNHTDHLDAETLVPVLANNPAVQFVIPEANRAFVCDRVKCDVNFPKGLSDGQSISIEGFTIYGIPAKHNEIDRDENGHCKYMGYVIGFDGIHIYHSGDTLLFDGMEELLKPFAVQLALLPINGNKPERKVAGNLDAMEAVQLAKGIGAQCVIPCHYHMFEFNTADPGEFIAAANQLQQPFRVLQGGERYSSPVSQLI